ncbi:MAG: hypothetical protein NTY98_07320 [Verrucomicrobia bacterium]|nr:hypothetical protein [Verrucomicrobiota bacterium]
MPLSLLLRAAFVSAFCISATLANADEPVTRCHKVNAPVGLSIRSKPGIDGKRLALLEEGDKVTLAGRAVADDKTKVFPVVSKDAQDPEASWVQISEPKAGYVLYRVSGSSPYDYLVPCK